jgi:hypothetical protein
MAAGWPKPGAPVHILGISRARVSRPNPGSIRSSLIRLSKSQTNHVSVGPEGLFDCCSSLVLCRLQIVLRTRFPAAKLGSIAECG